MASLSCLLSLCLLAADPQDALQTIESTRGGRHWADAPTAAPKSPEQSRRCFQLEPGLEIQLLAAEPLIFDPVAIAFDQQGRLFAVEYGDYPTGPDDPDAAPLSRVVVLEDSDHDGRLDKRTVFADKLTFAHSLLPWKEGILVGAQTELVFLKDTDGDLQADVRKTLFSGFQAAHPQMQIGNPRWGLDNWIYCNYGPGKIVSADGKKLAMSRNEFRFHPLSMEFGPATGLGQFGNTIDNWGRRFFCTNRNPIMTPLLTWKQWRRNPRAVIPKAHYDVGVSGGATRVYPQVAMKSNYLSHAGTHTSACGVTAYRGDLLGKTHADNVFVCEPIGHLVTRSTIVPDGPAWSSQRARPKADFLTSSDTWFRPASLATGPDGALYLADMYRLWVEHPKFLPPEIAQKLDWRAGEDRGRIWRIAPAKNTPTAKFQPPKTTADLVELLKDSNGWRRSLGQRLLVERQAQDAAPAVADLLREGESEFARLHALWTLQGIGALTAEHLKMGLADKHPGVRRNAARLVELQFPNNSGLWESLAKLASDSDATVRMAAALAAGETDHALGRTTVAEIAIRDGADPRFAQAILTSAKTGGGQILQALAEPKTLAPTPLVRDLAAIVGAQRSLQEIETSLRAFMKLPAGDWRQAAMLHGLAAGLPRYRGPQPRMDLQKLLAALPDDIAAAVRRLLEGAEQTALDSQRSIADRTAAMELLGRRPFPQVADAFSQLLSLRQPVAIQQAALSSLGQSSAAAEIVLKRWPTLGPDVRVSALALLLRRSDSTLKTLEAMAAGKVNPAVIDIDRRVRLLKHGDSKIRQLAERLLGGAVSANRREVARKYRPALQRKASRSAGAEVFKKACSKCHRIDGVGHVVGPDLSDVRNRSREALLYDILDPNRKLEPRFTAYTITDDDGRVFNGLMVSQTPEHVILKQAEGKQQIVPRDKIDVLQASGKSLMPEGVEKEVSLQQMADLLEFLKSPRD